LPVRTDFTASFCLQIIISPKKTEEKKKKKVGGNIISGSEFFIKHLLNAKLFDE
jgi:hypothetical protein